MIRSGEVVMRAMPDYHWGVTSMDVKGNTVVVDMRWDGTHTGTHELSKLTPVATDVPATGKRVAVADRWAFTVENDLITKINFQEVPLESRTGSFLEQIRVKSRS